MSYHGSCLCGAVHYTVTGALREVINCHCIQCRKSSGHYVAATSASLDDLSIVDEQSALAWYQSSPSARRGFCRLCGSSLFWHPDGEPRYSVMAGTLDGDTGLITREHIFVETKGYYYTLNADVPARDGSAGRPS
ncbi:MAG: GFA family protein [Chromatiales bacterium]|jgi:hypothetical protein|nr:GFA family protein [Chromatiales bacterium]